jgi:hypothetical protein
MRQMARTRACCALALTRLALMRFGAQDAID